MSPGVILALMMVAGTAGGLFYSYHIGRTQGRVICETEKLQSMLKAANENVKNNEALIINQQEQIGEAFSQLEEAKVKNEKLQESLDSLNLSGATDCIPTGVLDELRKFRSSSKNKNP
jgi:uncharacterized protein HemX